MSCLLSPCILLIVNLTEYKSATFKETFDQSLPFPMFMSARMPVEFSQKITHWQREEEIQIGQMEKISNPICVLFLCDSTFMSVYNYVLWEKQQVKYCPGFIGIANGRTQKKRVANAAQSCLVTVKLTQLRLKNDDCQVVTIS